jgi:hypothetical protein
VSSAEPYQRRLRDGYDTIQTTVCCCELITSLFFIFSLGEKEREREKEREGAKKEPPQRRLPEVPKPLPQSSAAAAGPPNLTTLSTFSFAAACLLALEKNFGPVGAELTRKVDVRARPRCVTHY